MVHLMEKQGTNKAENMKLMEKTSYGLLCMTWVNDDDYFIRLVWPLYSTFSFCITSVQLMRQTKKSQKRPKYNSGKGIMAIIGGAFIGIGFGDDENE